MPSAIFSSDLHSLGQYIQDGYKMLFETVIDVKKPKEDFYIKEVEGDFDGLNYLANQNMSEVTQKVLKEPSARAVLFLPPARHPPPVQCNMVDECKNNHQSRRARRPRRAACMALTTCTM